MAERRSNTCLALIGLIPCLMALIAEAIPAHHTAGRDAESLPSLSFSQFGVSYPEVPPIPVIGAQFEFVNQGDTPLTIEELKPSCGCLRVQLSRKQRTYQPGESGTILVHMQTANERPGPHFYTIDVTAQGKRTQREQLTFRVVLPERKVSIEPAEVYFYQLTGEPDTRTIFVTDYREAPAAALDVTSVIPVSRTLTAEVLPAEVDDRGHRRIPILLSVPGVVDPGAEETFVRIETSDPEFRHLAFPVLIQGPPDVYGPAIDVDALVDVFEIIDSQQALADSPTNH